MSTIERLRATSIKRSVLGPVDAELVWKSLPVLLDIAEFVKALASIADEGVTVPALRQMAKDALSRLEETA